MTLPAILDSGGHILMTASIYAYVNGLDPDHFRSYYVINHVPLVMEMPGLLGCRSSFDVAATNGGGPYFAVFEAAFADAAAMAAARSSAQGRRVTADVANRATGGCGRRPLPLAGRVTVHPGATPSLCRS